MNYLAHILIAQRTGTSLAGAILGDYVKGDGHLAFEPDVATGIRLHRRIDTLTDHHPLVRDVLASFHPPLRRYAGIALDVYFDHLLTHRWADWCHVPLPAYVEQAGAQLQAQWPSDAPFPARQLAGLPDLLLSYRTPAGVAHALRRIDVRLKRPSPLPQALPELEARHARLSRVFERFFPDLVGQAEHWVRLQRERVPTNGGRKPRE